MDKNVENMKKLLGEGYIISSHQMNFQKTDGENVMTDTITLKKDGDQKIITSTNSKEFFDYIKHFQKVINKYDNGEFIYIEDLEQYNKNIQKQPNSPALRDHHKLKISGYCFSESIMTIYFNPSGPNNKKGLAEFWIDLEKNPDFLNVDLKDELDVYDISNKLVFRGHIKNYESSDKTGFVFVQDMTLKMEHEKVSAEFNKMNPTDCVGLLTESMGFKFSPSPPYNTSQREFTIIIPVQNLIIDTDFRIGNVDFYQKFDTIDDSLIRKSDNGRNNVLWNGNFPRAKITIQANQFYEAISNGYKEIAKTIDIIALRNDLSLPSIQINGTKTNFNFSYYKNLSKVRIPTWVYCRENSTNAHCFYNIESLRENVLNLSVDPDKYFEKSNLLCNRLILKENPSQSEKNLLQSLHWLRRAIQEGNNKDKLIDLWTAFEFLVSGVRIEEILFTEEDKKELRNIISKTYYDTFQKNAINSKINMLNDPPLLVKFERLIKDLNLKFSEEELKILKKTRNKRNDLIHGLKDINVEERDLTKMRTIIEKTLIAKINQMES